MVFHVLNFSSIRSDFNSIVGGRSDILKHLGDYLCSLSFTLHEQKQISDYLNQETSKIDKIVEKETKRINLIKEYRQSLISNVVTGKMRITEDME